MGHPVVSDIIIHIRDKKWFWLNGNRSSRPKVISPETRNCIECIDLKKVTSEVYCKEFSQKMLTQLCSVTYANVKLNKDVNIAIYFEQHDSRYRAT